MPPANTPMPPTALTQPGDALKSPPTPLKKLVSENVAVGVINSTIAISTIPVSAAAAKPVTTIEGLERDGRLNPVQQAFLDAGAFQCAYCTSGMIMSSVGLLRTNPNPSQAEIVQFLQGNVCRCGTHPRIIEAVRHAAKMMQEHGQ